MYGNTTTLARRDQFIAISHRQESIMDYESLRPIDHAAIGLKIFALARDDNLHIGHRARDHRLRLNQVLSGPCIPICGRRTEPSCHRLPMWIERSITDCDAQNHVNPFRAKVKVLDRPALERFSMDDYVVGTAKTEVHDLLRRNS